MESGSTVTVQDDVIPELAEWVYGIIVYRDAEFVAVDAETVAGLPRTDGEVRLIIEDATPENINAAQIRTLIGMGPILPHSWFHADTPDAVITISPIT